MKYHNARILKTLIGLGSLTIIIVIGLFVAWVVGVLVLGKPIAVKVFNQCKKDKSPFSPCLAAYGTLGFLLVMGAVLFACLLLSPSIVAGVVLVLLIRDLYKDSMNSQRDSRRSSKKDITKSEKEDPSDLDF